MFKKNKALLWVLISLIGIALIAVGIAAYYQYQTQVAKNNQSKEPVYQTAQVERGDISLTISGTGTLEAGATRDLSFPQVGTVESVNVELGDEVKAGDTLATLKDTEELEQNVADRTLELETAREDLEDLTKNAETTLADAQINLSSLEKTYQNAQNGLHSKSDSRCENDQTGEYYYKYLEAQHTAYQIEKGLWHKSGSGYGKEYVLQKLQPALRETYLAYINWKYCEGYTEQEIQESEYALQVAKANFEQAEADFEDLKANNGVDPEELSLAEAKVTLAELKLQIAQDTLSKATLVAPIDGMVSYLAGESGEITGTTTFISLIDTSTSYVQAYMDEADLTGITAGCPAVISFDAISDRTYDGVVTSINPEIVTVNDYTAVETTVQLSSQAENAGEPLPMGMSATVDMTCNSAEDALLVPADAVQQEEDTNKYYVSVLSSDNKVEKRYVEIGIQNFTKTEIRSGLQEGETVILPDTVVAK
jgi:HlyD family secretion protein